VRRVQPGLEKRRHDNRHKIALNGQKVSQIDKEIVFRDKRAPFTE
jgi:hypothetical protein